MSEHSATVAWRRTSASFDYEAYNRDHSWSFDAGVQVRASAAPAFHGDLDCVDPEEAYVAALSGCHMLTFLAVASRKRLIVDTYEDHATGFMEKNVHGKLAVTRIVLRPQVRFSGSVVPSQDELAKLHEQAHHGCIIANSVLTTVTIEPA
ncbi:OsmC family protein [Candidatus Methylomirabilis sp.]|uniref:OsmC family protein n=1 Tax=Candidatus Methylomirabilis tolerans TaxID=3123416 RepID=A0AAJ1AGQ8_9BACT|nr:OsmC family protein [Candidatus Methylomirabilis sp.]